jgi:Ser/Thr protein kinase RdoA (MazF antagonist)
VAVEFLSEKKGNGVTHSGDDNPNSNSEIRLVLFENYGLVAELERLPGENLNFLACGDKGEKYVVKIAAEDQSEAFIEMEFLALRVARNALNDIALPQIIENKQGKIETCFRTSENTSKRLRLIDYLYGTLLEHADISEDICKRTGQALAEFDLALRSFDHPAAHRNHRWDLTKAIQFRSCVERVSDVRRRATLSWAFDQYEKLIAGKIDLVSWQFIHGDANPENILIREGRVAGLLDFGDSCYNPRVCELAICMPYLMMDQADPMAIATPVIEAYGAINPLSALEHELLWPLMLGRLASTISMAVLRRQIDPDHPNWFVSEAKAWRLLEQLRDKPKPQL